MINPYKSIRAGVKLSLMMILTLKPLGQALVGRPGKKSAKYSPDAQCEKLSADNDVVGVIVGVVGVIVWFIVVIQICSNRRKAFPVTVYIRISLGTDDQIKLEQSSVNSFVM